jgi:hypothetical protein
MPVTRSTNDLIIDASTIGSKCAIRLPYSTIKDVYGYIVGAYLFQGSLYFLVKATILNDFYEVKATDTRLYEWES